MVAQLTMRVYGVNKEFRFDEDIWLHRKSGEIQFFFGKYLFYVMRAQRVLSNYALKINLSKPGSPMIIRI